MASAKTTKRKITPDPYSDFTTEDIKDLCVERGRSQYGDRELLLARLKNDDAYNRTHKNIEDASDAERIKRIEDAHLTDLRLLNEHVDKDIARVKQELKNLEGSRSIGVKELEEHRKWMMEEIEVEGVEEVEEVLVKGPKLANRVNLNWKEAHVSTSSKSKLAKSATTASVMEELSSPALRQQIEKDINALNKEFMKSEKTSIKRENGESSTKRKAAPTNHLPTPPPKKARTTTNTLIPIPTTVHDTPKDTQSHLIERTTPTLTQMLRGFPYLFLSASDCSVRGDRIDKLKAFAKVHNFGSLAIRADETGYFVVFKNDTRGENRADKAFFALNGQEFLGRPLVLSLVLMNGSRMESA